MLPPCGETWELNPARVAFWLNYASIWQKKKHKQGLHRGVLITLHGWADVSRSEESKKTREDGQPETVTYITGLCL